MLVSRSVRWSVVEVMVRSLSLVDGAVELGAVGPGGALSHDGAAVGPLPGDFASDLVDLVALAVAPGLGGDQRGDQAEQAVAGEQQRGPDPAVAAVQCGGEKR